MLRTTYQKGKEPHLSTIVEYFLSESKFRVIDLNEASKNCTEKDVSMIMLL
jgi:hypothetical protein